MFRIGDRPVPGYELVRFIGRGAYGEVWEASAPGGARVALKFIALQSKTGSVELKALQAVKRIRHANLIQISAIWVLDREGRVLDDAALAQLDASGDEQETLVAEQLDLERRLAFLVIAMALADASLEDKLEEYTSNGYAGIPQNELIEYLRQAAKGLDFLNDRRHQVGGKTVGIVHRDVKPANLLLIGDSIAVGDFGVATTLREFDATATKLVGSLGFMAPESIARHPSSATDQYALAITYYRLRTGRLPYAETVTLEKLFEIHKKGKLEFDNVPVEEQAILRRATAQDPDARFESCAEFVEELAGHAPVEVSKPGQSPVMWSAIVIAAGILIFAVVVVILQPWKSQGEPAANNGNAAITDPLPSRTITFSPPNTQFSLTLDSASEPIEGSRQANLTVGEDASISVIASSPSPFYRTLERSYQFEELEQAGWHIELEQRDVEEVREEVFAMMDQDQQQALDLLRTAAGFDASILTLPIPEQRDLNREIWQAASGSQPSSYAVAGSDPNGATAIQFTEANSAGSEFLDTEISGLRALIQSPLSHSWFLVDTDGISLWADESTDMVRLWEPDAESPSRLLVAAMSRDGRSLAVGDSSGVVHLWDVGMDDQPGNLRSLQLHEEAVMALLFPADEILISAGQDRQIRRIDVAQSPTVDDGEPITLDSELDELIDLVVANTDQLLATYETRVFGGNVDAEELVKILDLGDVGSTIEMIRTSQNSDWFLLGTDSTAATLRIVSLQDMEIGIIKNATEFPSIAAGAFSPDGNWIVVSSYGGELALVDLRAEMPLWHDLPRLAGSFHKFLLFTPDGRHLITISEAGVQETWRFDRLKLVLDAQIE